MPVTPDEEEVLTKGLDYLGRDISLGLTGTSDVPAGSTGIPAPSAPGGMSGFAGGAGRPGGGVLGPSGGPRDLSDIAGLVQKVFGKVGQAGTEQTRGDTDQSLSDRIRSGGDAVVPPGTPGQVPTYGFGEVPTTSGGTPVTGMGTINGGPATPLPMGTLGESLGFPGVSDQAIMNMLEASGLGSEGIQGLLGETQIPQVPAGGGVSGAPGGASAVGGTSGLAGGAGSVAGMAIGPLLNYLGSLATKDSSPEMQAAIQGLTTALAPVAAPAVAGATTGAMAGTGALSGATGSLSAAGPGLVASAPMAAMIIATSINNMLSQAKLGRELQSRAKSLSAELPNQIAAIQGAPALLQQIGPNTTPEEAAAIYKQVEALQQGFQESGIEDYLQQGLTRVTGPAGQGSLEALFLGGPAIFGQLTPYMQAMDLARIRASDIAARGGQPIPGARPIYDYAYNLGSPEFAEMARPSSTTPQAGQVSEQLGKIYGPIAGYQAAPAGSTTGTFDPIAEGQVAAGPGLLQFAGLPAGSQATVADIERFLAPGGAGYGRVEQGNAGSTFIPTNYGIANREIFNALQAIQPGNYEAGLADVYGRYGGGHPGLARWGFGTGGIPVAAPSPLAAQINALIGSPQGHAEGMLTEEERRRAGM